MKPELLSALGAKLALGVATAATLGGATAIIKSAEINAVQDQRILRVEEGLTEVKELNHNLQQTSKEVALLRQELEYRREPSNR